MKPQPPFLSIAPPQVGRGWIAAMTAGSVVAALIAFVATGQIHLHAPRLQLLADEPPQVIVHLSAALAALAIGVVLLAGVKGSRVHRLLGWAWVLAMATTAVSSIFIRQINPGAFSWIHLFTGWTIVALPGAVWAARRRKVAIHARAMTGLFVGGLVVAGAFTFSLAD